MMNMVVRTFILAAAAFGTVSAVPAAEARDPAREQNAARRALQEGRILPLRAIEARIVPRMRGFDYLGPELDTASALYRLKFIRSGQIVWIDVDARTGQIIGHSGN
jgi:uncharacterized membrane protein YkoI